MATSKSANQEQREQSKGRAQAKKVEANAKAEQAEATEGTEQAQAEQAEEKINRSQKAAKERGITFKGRGANNFYEVMNGGVKAGRVTREFDGEGNELGWTFEGAPQGSGYSSRGVAAEQLVQASATASE